MRDLLFIGHATPQDNDFAIWLYSKLELEGYKVWCDVENLLGGEKDFWHEIQKVLDQNAFKYLLVYSKHTSMAEGVLDEFEYARSIAQQYKLKDFVIPLKIDEVSYTDRIGLNRYNIINFSHSWIPGLKKLFKKLDNDNAPKTSEPGSGISKRILNLYENDSKILTQQQERYYSSWWRIPDLPEKIYVYQYRDEDAARMVIEEGSDYPVILHGNCLASFDRKIKTVCENYGNVEIKCDDLKEVLITNILNGYESSEFPTLVDSENLLKRLLKKAFKNLMYDKGLYKHDLSNAQCFFRRAIFKNEKLKKFKNTIQYHNRKKSKLLIGSYYGKYWHFAVSAQVRLHPFLCFTLKSHIIFSDDGLNIWSSDSNLHSARRRKGKTWFNEQWRDQLMAFIKSLAGRADHVPIKLNNNLILKMPLLTEQFFSNVGYIEPETKKRLGVLHEITDELDDLAGQENNEISEK
jgi:TIR domain